MCSLKKPSAYREQKKSQETKSDLEPASKSSHLLKKTDDQIGVVHKLRNALEGGGQWFVTNLFKNIRICRVFCYEGGEGVKNLGKSRYVICGRLNRVKIWSFIALAHHFVWGILEKNIF